MNAIHYQHNHYVYFIGRSGEETWEPPVKVGITRSLRGRLDTIRTSCPFRLQMVEAIAFPTKQMAQEVEAATHKSLQAFRLAGEWFNICPSQAYRITCKIVRARLAAEISDPLDLEDTFTLMGNTEWEAES